MKPSLGIASRPGREIRLGVRVNPLAAALRRSGLLDEEDMEFLRALPYREASFRPGQMVLDGGLRTRRILIVAAGLAAVQTEFPNGTRQITDLLVAGDVHGLSGVLGQAMDHSVSAITPVHCVTLAADDLAGVLASRPRIYGALFWAQARRERVLRDHIRIVGGRTARKRVTQLLCCLQERREEFCSGANLPFRLEFNHTIIADAVGLTPVHVGRILRKLSDERLVRMGRGRIDVIDGPRLKTTADFAGIH
ncbi:Nitrogen fixation regulation protein FixK [Methylobacterium persicinum]|nr:Nitrogen fixation regulation protein FixK [Methylobacterium persicinum]